MGRENILGMIIMCLVSFGCGALFYGIGIWAQNTKNPMHFYSGTSLDPKMISDIPAYNAENARMWKLYSLPYFATGLLEVASVLDERLSIIALILLVTAGTIGIIWLFRRYKKICDIYML